MMLVIEYITIQTKGDISTKLKTKPWLQIIIAAIMGLIPGCLGTFAVVSMYIHRTIALPALVAALIATSGDEAFIMFSMIPGKALWLMIFIFIIAILSGFILRIFMKEKPLEPHEHPHFHENKVECICFEPRTLWQQIRHMVWQRAVILIAGFSFLLMIIFLGGGHEHLQVTQNVKAEIHENNSLHEHHESHEHDKHIEYSEPEEHSIHNGHKEHAGWGWERITFLIITIIGLAISISVPDHFLKDHLWGHVISKHFYRLFLWTFGAFLVLHIMNSFLDVEHWIQTNIYLIMLIAVLIGIIPESGPHIIFITLFAAGTIPISILVASSIVQDGHGSIPLLAESGKSFIIAKIINIAVGLIVGYTLLFSGF